MKICSFANFCPVFIRIAYRPAKQRKLAFFTFFCLNDVQITYKNFFYTIWAENVRKNGDGMEKIMIFPTFFDQKLRTKVAIT